MGKKLLAIAMVLAFLLMASGCESESARRQRELEQAQRNAEEARQRRDEAMEEYNDLKRLLDGLSGY